ncbi:monoamine oxidase [Nitzschia inconspicua]|uniref:Monoamine oxidase n=1 Tax=Nitzschia inconspicua TaxID=303405 RepID=A0A9K3KF48_9STRA|nr:monoamine oxidase [Nitzschia inconspicua]
MVWNRGQSSREEHTLPSLQADVHLEKSSNDKKSKKRTILLLSLNRNVITLICLAFALIGAIQHIGFGTSVRLQSFLADFSSEGNGMNKKDGFWSASSSAASSSSQSSPYAKSTAGCAPEEIVKKRIVIVGGGAAGLTAAKRLQNAPLDSSFCLTTEVTVLEATDRFGGRVGKDDNFTVYPLDLGASWVYDKRRLSIIAQEEKMEKTLEKHLVVPFELDDYEAYRVKPDGTLKEINIDSDKDVLWVNYTWYDFFEQKVAASLHKNQFVYDCPVDKIEYGEERGDLAVSCGNRVFVADHVIVTTSLAILKDDVINFRPPLPPTILEGRNPMWRGFKIFLEFSERFYDNYFVYALGDGELDWWDYSLVHTGSEGPNILAGYYMGEVHDKFEGMAEEQVVREVLKDLDVIYGKKVATKTYVRHKLVYWKDFPFIRGTYSSDHPPADRVGPQVIQDGNLLIAGEAFPVPPRHNGWVDGAAMSGLHAAEIILNKIDSSTNWFTIPQRIWKEKD